MHFFFATYLFFILFKKEGQVALALQCSKRKEKKVGIKRNLENIKLYGKDAPKTMDLEPYLTVTNYTCDIGQVHKIWHLFFSFTKWKWNTYQES